MRRLLIPLVAVCAVVLGFAQPAQAVVNLVYPNTTGTTHLAGPDLTVPIPTSLVRIALDIDTAQETNPLTGTAELPDLTVHLARPGVTAIVRIVPQGDFTGVVNWPADAATLTIPFSVHIVRAYLDSRPNQNLVGTGCTTATATSTALTSDSPIEGGRPIAFHGTYAIPAFTNCGPFTAALTTALSGDGNTLSLTLTP